MEQVFLEPSGNCPLPATLLDGKALAQQIRQQLALEVADLRRQTEIVPGLAVVLVGDDPASKAYVRNKKTACQAAGMSGKVIRLPASTGQTELLATIDGLNADAAGSWHPGAASAPEVHFRASRPGAN